MSPKLSTRRRTLWGQVCSLFLLLSLFKGWIHGQTYNLVDLGAALGTNSAALAVNDSGQVVGYWSGTNGYRAFRFDGTNTFDLGDLGGTNHVALGINDANEVAGYSQTTNMAYAAVLFGTNGPVNLGSFWGDHAFAFAISGDGSLAGHVISTNGSSPFLWRAGTATNLGSLGGTNGYALGIGSSNYVVGRSFLADNSTEHAFLFDGANLADFNLLNATNGWELTEARALNQAGTVVGAGITNGQVRAFLATNGTIVDLGILAGMASSRAFGVNASNRVVGTALLTNGTSKAFLWANGSLQFLDNLVATNSGWSLQEAGAVNDQGQIVGAGIVSGERHAFLLRPNQPPTVSLTTPTNSSTFALPTNIVLSATAADDVSVAKVEFFTGSTLLATISAPPYQTTWRPVLPANVALTAVATDNVGIATTSSVVNVMVTLPRAANLKGWFAADSITGVAHGATLSTWSDLSGLGNHATQSNASKRPTYVTNVVAGRPVVRFTGFTQWMSMPNLMNGATEGEAFLITRAAADVPSTAARAWDLGLVSAPSAYCYIDGNIYESTGSTSGYIIGDPPVSLTNLLVLNVSSKANEWIARLNSTELYRSTTNTVSWDTTPCLGGSDVYTANCYAGDIAEVLIYDRVLTTDEREAVGRYLNTRWSLVASVPTTPTNLVATAVGTNQVSLTWTAGHGTSLVRYEVERKTGTGSYALLAVVDNAGTYLDTAASASTSYTYRVRAVNWAGETGYSNEAGATTPAAGSGLPLSGLRGWFKADAGMAPGKVNVWPDNSGNGKHAIQMTGAKQPSLVTNAINGRPAVRFTGNTQWMSLPNLMSGATQGDAFVVTKATADVPSVPGRIWDLGLVSAPAAYPSSDGMIYESTGSTTGYIVGDPAVSLTNVLMMNVSSKSNEWVARLNGSQLLRSTTNTVSWDTTPCLGGSDVYTANCYAGDIAEVLIYDRVLTTDEREAVGRYLNTRWSLVASVPTTPTNLVATAVGTNQVSLTWTAGHGTSLVRYEVERKTGSGSYAQLAVVDNAGTYLDTAASAATTYTYRVRAVNWAGETGYSNEAGATTPAAGSGLPLSGLRGWFKADAGMAPGKVSIWPDQSGKLMDAMAKPAIRQPSLIANAIGNRPVVRFTGSEWLTMPDLMNGATNGEAFLVTRATADTPSVARRAWDLGLVSAPSAYAYTDGNIYESTGSTSGYIIGDPAVSLTNVLVLDVLSKPGEWVARLNSTRLYRSTTNTVSWDSTPVLGGSDIYTANCYAGDIAEVILYDRVLSNEERDAVGRYLNGRWGMVAAAPSQPDMTVGFAGNGGAKLGWIAPTNNVSLYFIERRLGTGGSFQLLTSVAGETATYTDTSVSQHSQPVYYRLIARNFAGDSSPSASVTAFVDFDGDGLSDQQELILGTNPASADTDGDGTNDGSDYFPTDPTRSAAPGNDPGDHSAPAILLLEPVDATLLP
jgi:probable HAF family extracellular repeat protein